MVQPGLLVYFVVWCWGPHFVVEASNLMHYSWGDQNVKGTFHLPEQKHFKSAPIHEVTWPGTEMDNAGVLESNQPPFVLPLFWHAPVPLASAHLLKPVAGKHPLPNSLMEILLPHRFKPPHTQVQLPRHLGVPKVEVSCGSSMIGVRVNMQHLGFDAEPSMFRLGTCVPMFVTREFLYFQYYLNECGSEPKTIKGKLMYSNTLTYSPEPQEDVLRAVPLSVPVHCQYNRFHYSYKVGFVPEPNGRIFLKSLINRRTFNLSVMNAKWEPLGEGGKYILGEALYFEVSTQHLSKDQQVFVDSCLVTPSQDSSSMPRQYVIQNFGCLLDSKRSRSPSRFYSRDSNVIRFSIDSFVFPNVQTDLLYLHCWVRVENKDPTATAKSCTYDSRTESWEELHGYNSVCLCCESNCAYNATSKPSQVKTEITSGSWTVEIKSASVRTLPEAEGNRETPSTEEDRSEDIEAIKEINEDILFEVPDRVMSNQTEISGDVKDDNSGGEEEAIIDQ